MSEEQADALGQRRGRASRDSDKRPPDTRPENPQKPGDEQEMPEVSVRDLRNAGKIFEALSVAGKTGRVTKAGRLIGWVVPATPEEQWVEELTEQGKLLPGKPGGLAGWRPLPHRSELPTLSETLQTMRDEEGR